MYRLCAVSKVVLIQEMADEWELVVQLHDLWVLCAGLHSEERVIARFRRHKNLPVTTRSCLGNDGSSRMHVTSSFEERHQSHSLGLERDADLEARRTADRNV